MKSFKPILSSITAVILMAIMLLPHYSGAQVVNASTKKRISIGVGMFTDIWTQKPDGMKTHAVNPGVNFFGTYNMPFGKSNFGFAIGLGMSIHNLYWNYRYQGDSTSFQFVKIEDTLSYKRSKLTVPYLEIPLEFRYKSKSKIAVAVGFKVGLMVYAHAKYKGEDFLQNSTGTTVVSFKGIKNLEKFSYGPTFRFGYKWFHVNAYYSLSHLFQKGGGRPEMAPISVGFTLLPY